ncbi:DUF4351 domain-containing protein [Methylomagnum sp.]
MFGFDKFDFKQTAFYQEAFGEGRSEGRSEGEALMLLRQLERKFRPLPDSVRQRILSADADTLLVWGERVLDAKTLADVWDN